MAAHGAMIAVAADGAGSAANAAEGAQRACLSFVALARAYIAEAGAPPGEAEVCAWAISFRAELDSVAQAAGSRIREYASTLLAVVLVGDEALFVQLGDGAIVVREEGGEFGWVFWPEQGEYANVTSFLTDANASERLSCERVRRRYKEIALFTDGLQRLVLNLAERTVHQPFFEQVMGPVRKPGVPDEVLSARLAAWLASDKVNLRTDDDKTLVLLRRE